MSFKHMPTICRGTDESDASLRRRLKKLELTVYSNDLRSLLRKVGLRFAHYDPTDELRTAKKYYERSYEQSTK